MSETQSSKTEQNGSTDHPGDRPLRGIEVMRLAKAYLEELTGKTCEQSSAMLPADDGWTVVLEVVELERIPQTTDILGSYAVMLDRQGELVGYERIRRYVRSQASADNSGWEANHGEH